MPQILAAAAGLAWPIETTSVGEGVLGLIINLSNADSREREDTKDNLERESKRS